jgi:hypothetical protein
MDDFAAYPQGRRTFVTPGMDERSRRVKSCATRADEVIDPVTAAPPKRAMNPSSENSHYVRRVVLPSGKTIEVVYFDETSAARERPDAPLGHEHGNVLPAEHNTDLHLCGSCGSDLVYPVEWEEAGTAHWEVALRCPNCEWMGTGIFEQDLVERFDEELDRGTDTLVRDLKRLAQANMEADVDRFLTALAADHIVPDDF